MQRIEVLGGLLGYATMDGSVVWIDQRIVGDQFTQHVIWFYRVLQEPGRMWKR